MNTGKLTCSQGELSNSSHMKRVESRCTDLYWTGFMYDESGRAQRELAQSIVSRFNDSVSVNKLFSQLRGNFFLALHDTKNRKIHATVDDSGLFSAYRSSSSLSIAFLDLCDLENIGLSDVCMSSVLEFIHLGNVYFSDTIITGIQKIGAQEIVECSASGCSVETKQVPEIYDAPVYSDLIDATEPLSLALGGESVSVDLTGGFDSRMLACLLSRHEVPYETALSGIPDNIDQALGEQVAKALDKPFHFSSYAEENLVDDLPSLLHRLDGLGGKIVTIHRLMALQKDRVERGISLSLKGSGGELFKDFFWMQDFPFFRSRSTRFGRLNRLRLEFEQLREDQLTPSAWEVYMESRQSRIKRMYSLYEKDLNTQSYDHFYFNERVQTWNGKAMTSIQNDSIACHAPLCEVRAVQVGYHTARRTRFYSNYHRSVIGSISKSAALLKTTDGTSASPEIGHLLLDSIGFGKVKVKKAAKKLSQIMLNKTRFDAAPHRINARAQNILAETPESREAFEALHDCGILRPHIRQSDLSTRFQEHALVAGWTLRKLSQNKNTSSRHKTKHDRKSVDTAIPVME